MYVDALVRSSFRWIGTLYGSVPFAGVTELMKCPPLLFHSSWMPPDGDANRITPSGVVPDPVMSLRTMMPALPYPERL